jgi:hypothetical protein
MGPDELAAFKLVLAALLMAYVEVRRWAAATAAAIVLQTYCSTALSLCSWRGI